MPVWEELYRHRPVNKASLVVSSSSSKLLQDIPTLSSEVEGNRLDGGRIFEARAYPAGHTWNASRAGVVVTDKGSFAFEFHFSFNIR